MIKERAYAKINLSLNVFAKRNDKFHELTSIMAPLDLYDELTFEEASSLVFESNKIYKDEICLKVARIIIEKYNIKKGVKITCIKNIPSEAGLGGGSSCAAAVVRGLNKFYDLNMTTKEALDICNLVGSDVAFCYYSKLAKCYGRGEVISLLDIDYKNIDVLLIKPDFGNATKDVYKAFLSDNCVKLKEDNNILLALENNDLELLKKNIYNDLKVAAIKANEKQAKLFIDIKKLKANFYLSGSGSTIFTFDNIEQVYNYFKDNYPTYKLIKTKIFNNK